jgi:uncharacterized membrane protein
MPLLAAFLMGLVTGSRSMLAPALTAWFCWLGLLRVAGTPMAFMTSGIAVAVFTVAAIGELVADKLPQTPSRKAPVGFIARVVMGVWVGATVGAAGHALVAGAVLGVAGAVIGTLGGAAARARLAKAFGRDLPAALLEDAVAILMGVFMLLKLA